MKLGWRIFIVVTACATGFYLSRKPWEVYRGQEGKSKEISSEMREAEQERERMMREKMKYGSSLGREQHMRDKGWAKPGETPIEPK
jgi:hypothetical protein